MKTFIVHLIGQLCLCIAINSSLYAQSQQWERIGGFYTSRTTNIAQFGDTLFVVQERDFLRSTNGGRTWESVDIRDRIIEGILFFGESRSFMTGFYKENNIIYSTNLGQVCRSLDAGLTWKDTIPLYDVLSKKDSLMFLNANPENRKEHGLFTYSLVNKNINLVGLKDKKPSNLLLLGQKMVATISDVIHSSPNNGKSWSQTLAIPSTTMQLFSCVLSRQAVLFAFGERNNIFRSLDSGQTWSRIQSPEVNYFTVRNDTIFAAGNGIHYSSDMGRTWKVWAVSQNLSFSKIGISGTRWFAIVSEVLYQSLDDGRTWQIFGTGLSFCTHPFVVGSTLWAHSGNALFRTPLSSFASGNNPSQAIWQQQGTNIPPRIAVTSSGTWFGARGGIEIRVVNRVPFEEPIPGGFFFSNDSGATWQPVPFFTNKIVNQVATVRNSVVAVSYDTITKEQRTYASVNNGRTWSDVGSNNYFLRLCSDGKRFFTFSRLPTQGVRQILAESIDGIEWTFITITENMGEIYSMSRQETGKHPLYVVSSFGVSRYDDEGWRRVFDRHTGSILINQKSIYIGTYAAGVLHSTDAGETWQAFNQGLDTTSAISALSMDNLGHLYAGRSDMYWIPYGISSLGCSGIYRTKLSTITSVQSAQNTSQSTYEIVPSITNDVLYIRLLLHSPERVQMTLCNILGHELPVLSNTVIQSGNQEFQIPIHGISQGAYFLRCRIGNMQKVYPIILQK